jgi:hypothetical protein
MSRGVEFVPVPGVPPDLDGICTSPGGLRSLWFRDGDANLLSLVQVPPR